VANVGLPAGEGQDNERLRGQPLPEPLPVGKPHGHQLLAAVQQVRDRPLADRQSSGPQLPIDLRNAALVGGAAATDEVMG
jgi:hypothetical protein